MKKVKKSPKKVRVILGTIPRERNHRARTKNKGGLYTRELKKSKAKSLKIHWENEAYS